MTLFSDCLIQESKAIKNAAKNLDSIKVQKALELIFKCSESNGKLIITGVGKSGIVARKIAATFSSVGLMSIFLNPLDALHGDIGVAKENDLSILLTNSGETKELIEIIPHLKKRNIKIITILGKKDSTISKQSDVILETSVDKEICPLNLAPTASTAVSMAIGDAMAIAWMHMSGISEKDFAFNHPSGQLGKRLTLEVKDIMRPIQNFKGIYENTNMNEIISEITKGGAGFVWVKNSDKLSNLVGIITDGDLRRSLQKYSHDKWGKLTAKDLMIKDPITISFKEMGTEALKLMERNRKKPISILPVTNELNKIIGILKLHDLLQEGIK